MTTTSTAERTVTIAEAQQVAGVSRRTIYNWLKAGKLVYKRTAGGSVRIFESSLWRDANQSGPREINAARG